MRRECKIIAGWYFSTFNFFLRFQYFPRIFDINNLVAFFIPMCILHDVYRARIPRIRWIGSRKEATGNIRVVHHADGYSCRRASRKLLYAGNTSFISRSISIATILGSGINSVLNSSFVSSSIRYPANSFGDGWEKGKYRETTMVILSSGISLVVPIRRYIQAL